MLEDTQYNSPVSMFMILLLQTASSPRLQVLVGPVVRDVVSLVVSVVWTGVWPGVLHTNQLVGQATVLLLDGRPDLGPLQPLPALRGPVPVLDEDLVNVRALLVDEHGDNTADVVVLMLLLPRPRLEGPGSDLAQAGVHGNLELRVGGGAHDGGADLQHL